MMARGKGLGQEGGGEAIEDVVDLGIQKLA